MHTFAWYAGSVLGELATIKLATREMALLIVLATSLLVFRTLRERCLMVWIIAWVPYLLSRHAAVSPGPYTILISHAEFISAVTLFVAGSFIYAKVRDWLAPLASIGVALTTFSVLNSALW